jgi:hypothetical protein
LPLSYRPKDPSMTPPTHFAFRFSFVETTLLGKRIFSCVLSPNVHKFCSFLHMKAGATGQAWRLQI